MIDTSTHAIMASWRVGSDVLHAGGIITRQEIREFTEWIRAKNGNTLNRDNLA